MRKKFCKWLSHATHFKSTWLDLSDTFCSSIVSIIIKMFHQFLSTNNRDFDWQKNLHLPANVSIGRDSIMLFVLSSCLLIMLSRRLWCCLVYLSCHVSGISYLKKLNWTLDSGPWSQDLPPKQKNVKKLLQITLPGHLLKFCRKRNRNNVFAVEHAWTWGT